MEPIYSSKFIRPAESSADKVWRFFKSFVTAKKIRSAILTISARGAYTAELNGEALPSYVLAPGFTTYQKRLQYQQYDVTESLCHENTLSISVGIGFYFASEAGFRNFKPDEHPDDPLPLGEIAVIAALAIVYTDGSEETLHTDGSWLVEETKWRYAQMYNGDLYDATYVPSPAVNAVETDVPTACLIPQEGEVIAEQEHLPVKEVIHTPAGETVLDFGQNLTGYLSFRIKGERGEECCLSHCEVLDRDGNFYTKNYRSAKAQLRYICDGEEHIFKPLYTFYGFRYVRVDAWSGPLDPTAFTAIVVHSEMERTGFFSCSSEKLNQLFHNIIWGQKGNFLDIPTDCPQRDERYGWTGDAQVFCRCASLNFNTLKFFRKWLGDMRADQNRNGTIGKVIPRLTDPGYSVAAWSDVCTVLPYQMYLTYGDKSILAENYEMMCRWVNYMRGCFDVYVGPDKFHYGDWLALDAAPGSLTGATPRAFVAAAYACCSTEILIKTSRILGKECTDYEAFYEHAKAEIYTKYLDEEAYAAEHPGATLHTQTRLALLLFFRLYRNEEERKSLSAELNGMVRENGNRLTTGFVGTPYLLHALSENGYPETAYDLLLQEAFPSWLFSVNQGATTMWEHWDGIREDGTMWSDSMNSFNHYAYGAVGDWMYSNVLGINYDAENPGFAHVVLHPIVTDRLSHAEGSIKTAHGTVASAWRHEGSQTAYTFKVPAGVTATIILPGIHKEVGEGEYRFVC